jgi:uncharacterized phage protein (TIGR01671 family)
MNRQMKVRVWDREERTMNYVGEAYPSYPDQTFFVGMDGKPYVVSENECIDMSEKLLPLYSTGLTDRNGKEIYEGDIAKSPHGGIGIVEFHNSWAAFYYKTVVGKNEDGKLVSMRSLVPFWNDAPKFEVIGNIYEHPHLLEG